WERLSNPNSPKVVLNADNFAMYFSRSVVPYLRGVEQSEWLDNHVFYKHLGVYAYRLNVLKEITSLQQTPLEKVESLEQLRWLEHGYKIKVGVTNIETIGIDTPEDLERAKEFASSIGLCWE
ncbi:MAG: 3-deoxy-manno-octulosonate cytidylyltransferase, partial [Bacteroidaceae bacterium]|nr:3-deoxy-manno-octulosonate cytidylyltransferase [Bacteroidaceae bacterium]